MIKFVRTFHDKYPLIGPIFWILSVQYFLTQAVVAKDWANSYSLRFNTISDLGNTACGAYGIRNVCSPLHTWMNASFIVLGIFMVAGSLLIYQEFIASPGSRLGFSLMALSGLGTILVGLFPENTIGILHEIGAGLPFMLGNLALIIFGLGLSITRPFRYYSVFSGLIALIALVLLLSDHYLGLGIGGMERLTAYPQTIWLIVFGLYMSKNHFRKAGHRRT